MKILSRGNMDRNVLGGPYGAVPAVSAAASSVCARKQSTHQGVYKYAAYFHVGIMKMRDMYRVDKMTKMFSTSKNVRPVVNTQKGGGKDRKDQKDLVSVISRS